MVVVLEGELLGQSPSPQIVQGRTSDKDFILNIVHSWETIEKGISLLSGEKREVTG